MTPNLQELAERVMMERWQSAFPHLKKTDLQLVYLHLSKAALRLNLLTELKYLSDELREEYFTPPDSPEEKTIMVLADLLMVFLFPKKTIPGLIEKAGVEIEEAYRVIMQDGGGWSSAGSNPEKRKTAVLEWYLNNPAQFSYLKETYLQDLSLYYDGGGQEKRNFHNRLIIKIVENLVKQRLTFQKVDAHLKNLKKSK